MLPSPRADRARAQTAEADAHSKEAAEQRIAELERELEERNTRAEMLKEVVSDLTARLKNVKLAAADAHATSCRPSGAGTSCWGWRQFLWQLRCPRGGNELLPGLWLTYVICLV